jgi:endo-1,4-beta-xylanase
LTTFAADTGPSLTVYLPDATAATGAGIVVMPGGGHRELWTDHEGHRVAAWLSAHGVSAFVLKYRLAREEGSRYTVEDHALADARRALRTVRQRAAEWRVDPQRLGVMGFSAGGELAALAAMRGEAGRPEATDPVERQGAQPAFQVLVYSGRSQNILPTPQSPPAFLLCGADDRPDISEGLASVYLRFKQAGVPSELHVYSGVGHGFGVRASNTGPVAHWLDRLYEWMDGRGLLKK